MTDYLIKLDIWLFKVFTQGRYYPGELASSAAWRMKLDGRRRGRVFVAIIDTLFLWRETEHCKHAYHAQSKIYGKDYRAK